MREDLVYVRAKAALQARGFDVIAGQPPRGTDHLPVVEIKAMDRTSKGSGGAFKPDIVAWRRPWVVIGECKPLLDAGDVAKLRAVLGSPSRLETLALELGSRGIIREAFLAAGFVAYGGPAAPAFEDIGMVVCHRTSHELVAATAWPQELADLFNWHEFGGASPKEL